MSEKGTIQLLFDFKFVIKVIQGGISDKDSKTVAKILASLKSIVYFTVI